MTGQWPEFEIDHINRDKQDDRWANLREVTRSNQMRNRHIPKLVHHDLPQGIQPSRNKTGWIARWQTMGKRKESKTFYTVAEAIAFRKTKLIELGLHDYSPEGG
jgi:HNH endonuclease